MANQVLGLSQRDRSKGKKSNTTTSNLRKPKVRSLDAAEILNNQETQQRLRALAKKPDSEIDDSDIPELTAEQLANMVPVGDMFRSRKELISLRVDKDTLAFYRELGRNHQSVMNFALRFYMDKVLKPSVEAARKKQEIS